MVSTLWIGTSIFSINFGVVGYMALWGVRLDTVALVNLIMCLGFSVDYVVHMSYSFLTVPNNQNKIRLCLYKMALPIIQCGTSTIIAIIVFIFTPSYINRTFFKILFLVTTFGMLHSLLLLPVMLSLFSKNKTTIKDSSASPNTSITLPCQGNFKSLNNSNKKYYPHTKASANKTNYTSSGASDKSIESETTSYHSSSSISKLKSEITSDENVDSARL